MCTVAQNLKNIGLSEMKKAMELIYKEGITTIEGLVEKGISFDVAKQALEE